ncbi:MAG: hypothetical protein KC609_13960, partial [Myxococcales bacterium]|nr:hypothetical protein [Myxococcales bacterium]
DFGLVRVGCASQQRKVTIYNTGTAPLEVTKIEPQNCPGEFKLFNLPILPIEVTNTQPVTIEVYYEPTDLGTDTCNLLIQSSDQNNANFVIPMKGEGTDSDFQVDEFVQLSGQKVDILFVVDNSGSMGEEQDNLSANFDALIKEAKKWNSDFQLGIVTVEIEENNSNRGKLRGDPRIIKLGTPPDYTVVESQFKSTIKVGTGYSGAQEAGLEAARIALTPPLITDTGLSCAQDADCPGADLCVQNICGGYNRGFLREDASLEIVIISDEEDQSPGGTDFYIDFFKNIKGYQNDGLMHVSVIVGPKGGCTNEFGSAEYGKRYIEVANATNGDVESICSPTFSQTLEKIGNRAFGLKVQFFLTRAPVESTIKVFVDNVQKSSGWTFAADSNSIIFDQANVPQANQKIRVEYTAMCFQYN